MQEVRLYDPARKPPFWLALMTTRQFAVCHFDYKTGTWRTARGTYSASPEEETILIFDSQTEARTYCSEFVDRHAEFFCRIYDQRGTAEGLVETIYPTAIAAKLHARVSGPRHIRRGVLQLTVAVLCVFLDWRITGIVMLGVVVGSKFLWSGLNSLSQGLEVIVTARKQKGAIRS